MILRKTMSLLGVGSAKIDLILEKDTFVPGEKVQGYFLLKGGTIEQHIKRIDCDLVLTDKDSGSQKVLETTTILTSRVIGPEEVEQIPFRFKLQDHLQIATNLSYRFKTRLVFDEGVESKDQDKIHMIAEESYA